MSQAEAIAAQAIEAARKAGADQVDVVLAEGDALEARVRDAAVDFVTQSRERVLGLRVLVSGRDGNRTAVTSSSDWTEPTIAKLAGETVALARTTAEDPAAGLPDGGFASDWPDLGLSDAGDRGVSVEARIEDAKRAEGAARGLDPRITNSEGSQVSSDFSRITYANSAGFTGSYETASHSLFSEPLATEGESMQRDYWLTVGHTLADLEDPAAVGRRAAERALRRLGGRPVPTCEVPILFDAMTARSLVGHIAGCVSGYAVYRGSSFLAEKRGEAIANARVTVVDDGRRPGGLGSKPFDGEGLPTRRTPVVTGGVLENWLLDTYSARKLGLASTGNASRGAGSGPSVGPTNLWLEPGDATLDELVADTPRGLLVTELIGMGFNPVTGDYSRGAAGLWIENGRIAHPVEEVTIAGNLADMLQAIDAVGSELTWLGRIAAPPLRVAQMTVAGSGG
ncbi:MAG: TldD/PmbA family protein [Proteobacteria bacterium]|nr:TldD/PmbA family protein [Pseudomonadota bacterium]